MSFPRFSDLVRLDFRVVLSVALLVLSRMVLRLVPVFSLERCCIPRTAFMNIIPILVGCISGPAPPDVPIVSVYASK